MKRKERGASLVEYALLVACIALGGVISMRKLGHEAPQAMCYAALAQEGGSGQSLPPFQQGVDYCNLNPENGPG